MAKEPGIYRPRLPQKTPFYQCIADHFEEFVQVYDERYVREYGFWRPVIAEVVEKYLECGDLAHGFARIRCENCGHEYILAFSCKGRYFCPSCHMKRVLQFSEWLTQEILENVTHQQYVFTIPKIIRPYFKYDRKLLGRLCLCAWDTITEFFGACLPTGAVPGAVISIQTWGDTANFHPHLHGLVTKGGFDEREIFHPLPWIDTQKMALVFMNKVFTMLMAEEKISKSLAQKVASWPHSGFNIHNGVEIDADDTKGRETLAQYIIKAPVSQERMLYDREDQKVVYASKRGTVSYEPLDWLAAITSHIPNKGAQCVHYYGIYSNKSRGIREKTRQAAKADIVIADTAPAKRSCSKKWAALIKKIYEVDPLSCPSCSQPMRIIAIIDQPEIIEKILKHLVLWQPQAHGPPIIEENNAEEETIYDYSSFDYLPA
jgi:Zn finger protein HypA/HybF involved in hydrogenase expression